MTVRIYGETTQLEPCPTCRRLSGLTAIDGRDCLACSSSKAFGRRVGEGVWSAATDNAGIGWR